MWVNTTESPVYFRAVRGSTCSQVAGTVTSYHIAEQARFLPVRVPMKAFIAVVAGNAIENGI